MFKKLLNLITLPFRFLLRLPNYILPHRLMRRLSSRKRKAVNLTLITFLLVGGGYLAWTLLTPNTSDASWWNDSWMYRQTVPVANSGSALTNAQIPITLDTATLITAGKMKSDCSDIRVTNLSGELLKHWVHLCNNASTVVYVFLDVPSGSFDLLLYYGNSNAPNIEVATGTAQYPGISCKTVLDHNDGSEDKQYTVDPNAGTTSDAFLAYCDMTTDSGGWSVVTSQNGSINQQGLTSNTEVYGDPFSDASSNISTQKKQDLSLVSSESLIKRSTGVWIKADDPLFDGDLTTAEQHPHNSPITLTANDGTQVTTAVMGYSNYLNSNGGDFGITTSVGFDHHNTTTYYHLRSGCANHYFYKYGTTYNVNTALGSWTQTTSCSNNSTAMGAWYAGMRGTITPQVAGITVSSLTNEQTAPSPAAYWAFDEGTGTVANDSSGNQNTGTLQDTPAWIPESQCIAGGCLQFNGTSEYVSVANKSILNPTTGLTAMGWVKLSSVASSTNYNIIAKQDWGNKLGYRLGITGWGCSTNCLFMGVGDGVNQTEFTTDNVDLTDLGTWHHLAGVFDSGNLYLYIDGKLIDSTTTPVTSIVNTSSGLTLARHSSGGEFLPGFIDEPKVYNYALSAQQIAANYSSRGGGGGAVLGAQQEEALSQGLVGYWKMDQASWNGTSGEVIDSSGIGNNGTAVNGAEASTSAKFGNAGYFAGVDERVVVPSASSLNIPGAISLSAWIYSNESQNQHAGIIANRDSSAGGSANDYTFYVNSNTLYMEYYNGSSWIIIAGPTISHDEWMHLVVTRDAEGEAVKFYVDGELSHTGVGGGPGGDYASNPVAIGADNRYGATSYFDGNIDEARIYNRALDPSEVQQLYQFAPGPVAYYPFEETGGASTIADRSSSGLNLTVGGSPQFVVGKYGRAIKLAEASSTDRAYLQNSLFKLNNYTYGFWFRYDSPFDGTYRQVFSIYGDTDREPAVWRKNDADCFHAMEYPSNQGFSCAGANGSGSGPWEVGKWYYYSQTKNGTTLNYYVNGSLKGTTTVTDPMASSANPTFSIGSNAVGYTAAGITLDEFRLYNYARTPAQITQDMNAGHPIGGSPVASQVGYWEFDEGYGTTAGNSGNQGATLNGTITGAMWTDEGKFGRALMFDGVDDSVTISDNPSVDFANGWTIGGWYKPAETVLTGSDRQVLISKWQTSSSQLINYFLEIRTDGKVGASVANGAEFPKSAQGTTILQPNSWYYLVGTFDGDTGELKVYVNGKLEGTTDTGYSAAYVNTGNVALGQFDFAWSLYRDEYKGFMDEVKIYNSALTADQVKLDMNQGSSQVMGAFGLNPDGTASNSASQTYCVPGDFTTSSCKPVGEWNFEQGQGLSVQDTSGNGNTGTWSGSGPKWRVGYVGKGGVFNGTNDYVNIPGAWLYDNQTVSFWAKANWGTAAGMPVSSLRFQSPDHDGFRFIASPNQMTFSIYNANQSEYGHSASVTGSDWHHFTMSWTPTTTTSYVDGVMVNRTSRTNDFDSNTSDMDFGRYNFQDNNYFNGQVDQVRVYDYELSPAQVAWDYNRGKPVAYYDFDECQGSTLHEYYNSGMNGAITIGGSGSQASVGTCQTASTAWGNGVNGKFNYSLNFDGTDDYVGIPDAPSISLSSGPSSWFAWIKGGSISSTSTIIRKQANDYVLATVGSKVWCELETTNSVNTGETMSNGQWYHVGCTFDGTTLRSYLNGKLQGSTSASAGSDANGILYLGASGGSSQFFSGQIDEVQLFNYGLTDVQIRNLYNQSSAIRFGPSQGAP